ncbi:MAG: hypothetical protein ABWX59_09965 [Microbacteriaceae bacterium]
MNTITTPAPARTDATIGTAHTVAAALPTSLPATFVRLGGGAIAALVAAFAVLIALPWPAGATVSVAGEIGAIAFQVSTLVLLFVMWRTRAVGDSVGWRCLGVVVTVLVTIAVVTMIVQTVLPNEITLFAANLSWYLAMAGMFLVGVGVVARGQWRGLAGFLPLAAHSWPLVVLPVMLLTGDTEGQSWMVYVAYLAVTQALIGLVLAIRPQLTGARR